MRGPYEWVPPLYWYTDTKLGGPHGFATEIGPGPAPPPLESLKRFLPEDQLWPINEAWNYHCGGGPFKTLDVFTKAHGRALRPVEGRRGVRAQGPGRGLRVAPRDARVLRRAQVHRHRRHPVDAEQRLAGDDLAPLRLLPAAGRLVLRREEGRRAAARAVRLRRPLGRGRQRRRCRSTAGSEGDRPRPRPRVEGALRADGARGRGPRRQREGLRGAGAAGPDPDVLPRPHRSTTRPAAPSAATSTGSRRSRTSSPGTSRTGTYTPRHASTPTSPACSSSRRPRSRRRPGSRAGARASPSRTRRRRSPSSSTWPSARARAARRCSPSSGTTTTSRCCRARPARSTAAYAPKDLGGATPGRHRGRLERRGGRGEVGAPAVIPSGHRLSSRVGCHSEELRSSRATRNPPAPALRLRSPSG